VLAWSRAAARQNTMIIIVHGSILAPSSNNWAAIVGCNGGDPPAYIQFLRTLLLQLRLNAEKKLAKMRAAPFFKQKQHSCQKKRFHLRISSILWWF
jgi:hypothetical protein